MNKSPNGEIVSLTSIYDLNQQITEHLAASILSTYIGPVLKRSNEVNWNAIIHDWWHYFFGRLDNLGADTWLSGVNLYLMHRQSRYRLEKQTPLCHLNFERISHHFHQQAFVLFDNDTRVGFLVVTATHELTKYISLEHRINK